MFVITESNSSSPAYALDSVPAESAFSHYFYYGLDSDYSDTVAYNYAKSHTEEYYENEIEPEDYPIDQGPQYILKDDQILYTWFEWW